MILSDHDDVWHFDLVATAVTALAGDHASTLLRRSTRRRIWRGARRIALFNLGNHADARAALTDGRAFETLLRRNLATGATVAFWRSLLDDALPFPAAWVHDEWLTVLAAVGEEVANFNGTTRRLSPARFQSDRRGRSDPAP